MFYIDMCPARKNSIIIRTSEIISGNCAGWKIQRQLSLACNLSHRQEKKLVLMTHHEVRNFVHEFGTLCTSIVTRAK